MYEITIFVDIIFMYIQYVLYIYIIVHTKYKCIYTVLYGDANGESHQQITKGMTCALLEVGFTFGEGSNFVDF